MLYSMLYDKISLYEKVSWFQCLYVDYTFRYTITTYTRIYQYLSFDSLLMHVKYICIYISETDILFATPFSIFHTWVNFMYMLAFYGNILVLMMITRIMKIIIKMRWGTSMCATSTSFSIVSIFIVEFDFCFYIFLWKNFRIPNVLIWN